MFVFCGFSERLFHGERSAGLGFASSVVFFLDRYCIIIIIYSMIRVSVDL